MKVVNCSTAISLESTTDLTVHSCQFQHNILAIFADLTSATITDSSFSYNQNAIKITQASIIYISNTNFTFNGISTSDGGAINIDNSKITGENILFQKNVGRSGGALHSSFSQIDFSTIKFLENSAVNGGAAVILPGGSSHAAGLKNIIFNKLTCSNNIASIGGCVIVKSLVIMNNSEISHNYAETGAGIYIEGGYGNLKMDNNSQIFKNIGATLGGGIYASDTARLQMKDCRIYDNVATNGGGIYSYKSISIYTIYYHFNFYYFNYYYYYYIFFCIL